MDLVTVGLTNKEIARLVGPRRRTVEIHRAHVMEKMQATTLADLVRAKLLLGDLQCLRRAEPRVALGAR